jgi:hypothetical protein
LKLRGTDWSVKLHTVSSVILAQPAETVSWGLAESVLNRVQK